MKPLLLITTSLILSSCSMFQAKLDTDRLKKVKTVAIVAFEIQQVQPTDNLGIGKLKDMMKGSMTTYTPKHQLMAKKIYNTFRKQLATKTRWNVLSDQKLKSNSFYSDLVQQKMKGARLTTPLDKGAVLIDHGDLLDITAFRRMSITSKKELAKRLGVDALAEFNAYIIMDQSWISLGHLTGSASFDYTSRANFMLYTKSDFNDPAWRIQNVSGQEFSSKSLSKNVTKEDKISRIGLKAADSSIKKLLESYKL